MQWNTYSKVIRVCSLVLSRMQAIRFETWLNDRYYSQKVRDLKREQAPAADVESVEMEYFHDAEELSTRLYDAYSDRVIAKAQRLWIMTPGSIRIDDKFERNPLGIFVLKQPALAELQAKIREERKARREVLAFWFSVVGATLIGLIGAVSGLIAVFKSK